MIIGSGVVGQASGKGLIKKGNYVTFVDNNKGVVKKLKQEGFVAYLSNDLDQIDADISMVSVPTPSKKGDGSADLSYITSAMVDLGRWLKNRNKKIKQGDDNDVGRHGGGADNSNNNNNNNNKYHLVVIRSTVPVGTCRNVLLPLLQTTSEMSIGRDFGLCMQPEFMRTLTGEHDFLNPHATVIGEYDKRSGDELEKIYSDFGGPLFRVEIEEAEFMKYVHNCFNATKISFANEMWQMGQKIGIDANFALQMAVMSAEGFWNPKYGTVGGRPYGGPCLPKDVKALLDSAKKFGVNTPLLSAVDYVNSQMEEQAEKGKVPYATLSQPEKPPFPTTNITTPTQSVTIKKKKRNNNNKNNNNKYRNDEYVLSDDIRKIM
jgi:UDPglucose 6-dehydrogenase